MNRTPVQILPRCPKCGGRSVERWEDSSTLDYSYKCSSCGHQEVFRFADLSCDFGSPRHWSESVTPEPAPAREYTRLVRLLGFPVRLPLFCVVVVVRSVFVVVETILFPDWWNDITWPDYQRSVSTLWGWLW